MTRPRPFRVLVPLIAAITMAAGAVGCGDDTTEAAGSGPLQVNGAWARATVAAQTTGAVYFSIVGGAQPDTLTKAAVPGDVAAGTALHKTMKMDGHDMGSMQMGDETGDTSGEMGMEPLAELPVAAGQRIEFEPGSYHVMLTDLAGPLEVGRKFTLTLTFRTAGELQVPVEVRT